VLRRAQAHDFERGLARRVMRSLIKLRQVAPDHQLHHPIMRNLLARQLPRELSIPQHDHAIRQLLHFSQPMRNVNDRHPLGSQVPHDLVKLLGLMLRKR
jgi:hypothetical protein